MTDTITKAGGEADGVHRLVDMVVEEVSLVDRAANKHRFLIVKRDDAMDDDTTLTEVATATADEGTDDTGGGPAPLDDDSPLGAAVAALEGLTDVVELLSSMAGEADPRLARLAEQLGSTAEQLLARIGVSSEETSDAQPVEARATPRATGTGAAGATAKLQASLAAMKAAARRLSSGCAKPPAAGKAAKAGDAPAASADAEAVATAKGLTSVSESLKQLTDVMKAQHQRLSRLEKQSGLPNSAAPAEHLTKAAPEDLGWPMDLNKPMDRENVDKALSFHDV